MRDDFCSAKELAELFDIDLISAEELLDGTIEFEVDELFDLACYKGITVGTLLNTLHAQRSKILLV